jgi:hypothetical protein
MDYRLFLNKLGNYLNKNRKFLVGLAIVLLCPLIYCILGENAQVWPHDNLDIGPIEYKLLIESGQIFAPLDTQIMTVMNGIPRDSLPSEFTLLLWLYVGFEPFPAYVLNETIFRIVAYFGMYLFLKIHVFNNEKDNLLSVGGAMCFALLPFFNSNGLSAAGQPLVMYAFLNIRNSTKNHEKIERKNWIILLLVPFYAINAFFWSFLFLFIILGVMWVYDVLKTRKLNVKFVLSILLMGGVFLLVEYRRLYQMFFSDVQSIRGELKIVPLSFSEAVSNTIYYFRNGASYVPPLNEYIIVIVVGITIILIFLRNVVKSQVRLFLALLILIAAVSLFAGFWFFDGFTPVKNAILSLTGFNVDSFNMTRFYWLYPFLWTCAFVVALGIILHYHEFKKRRVWGRIFNGSNKTPRVKPEKWGRIIVVMLLTTQVVWCFANNDQWMNGYGYSFYFYQNRVSSSWKDFYSEDLFQQIKNDIGRPQESYRVVSIGMHPTISQYSGFYTLDGYNNYYNSNYKQQFRHIIAKELEKSSSLKAYFDNWGGRCYVFVAEIGIIYNGPRSTDLTRIYNLELNSTALKNLGGEYVFSAVEIVNAFANNLTLYRTYENSALKIYLYNVTL